MHVNIPVRASPCCGYIHACVCACEPLYIDFLAVMYPQIPRYILTLHELLAHTPHEHIERNSLDYAKSKLEELSRYLHMASTEQFEFTIIMRLENIFFKIMVV